MSSVILFASPKTVNVLSGDEGVNHPIKVVEEG